MFLFQGNHLLRSSLDSIPTKIKEYAVSVAAYTYKLALIGTDGQATGSATAGSMRSHSVVFRAEDEEVFDMRKNGIRSIKARRNAAQAIEWYNLSYCPCMVEKHVFNEKRLSEVLPITFAQHE